MLSSRLARFGTIKNNVRYISANAAHINTLVEDFNTEIRNGGIVPAFKLAALFENRFAIQDHSGEVTYRGLFEAARGLAHQINHKLCGQHNKTVAYLCPGDTSHVYTLWAIWMSGNIAVPLSPQHPPPMTEYYLKDSGASIVIREHSQKLHKVDCPVLEIPPTIRSHALLDNFSPELDDTSKDCPKRHINLDEFLSGIFYAQSDAIILYTSGTTSNPKGAVHGYNQLAHQIASLHHSWRYRADDTLLHCLPLNHVHGLVASVCAGLAAGAKIRMMSSFSSAAVWAHLLGMKKRDNNRITVFMGVPTMYAKLIEEYDKVFVNSRHKEYIKSVLMSRMRLMISGSAPLPNSIFERWEEISGHRLLERYGMTEIGLALSNPYEPVKERTPGYVGTPLPGITAKIGNTVVLEAPRASLQINLSQLHFNPDKGKDKTKNLFEESEPEVSFDKKCKVTYLKKVDKDSPVQGELLVKGPAVMREYWQRPDQTSSELSKDGWFKTGDTAVYENGRIKIMGRTSVDIIKSGGYKISALEVEAATYGHPCIADIVILGLPDITWGEKVTAVVELKEGSTLNLKELQEYGAEFIPKYQLPTALYVIPKMPRNAMGKVNKKELCETLINQSKK